MSERKNISSGAPWEPIVGYSRAVRVGPNVWVAGTTSVDAQGNKVGKGDAEAQARQIFRVIEAALEKAGAKMEHVVRTRTFLTDVADWEKVGRVHGEVFRDIRPAATMLEVSKLLDPDLLVEIEVDAYVTAPAIDDNRFPPSYAA